MDYLYRPFDLRSLFWIGETKLLDRSRSEAIPHLDIDNRWLVAAKGHRRAYDAPLVTSAAVSYHVNERATFAIPLHLAPDLGGGGGAVRENPSQAARAHLDALGGEAAGATAEALFHHALAVLHAPAYAAENAGALKQDWPRVPLPPSAEALAASAGLGRRVAALLDPDTAVPGVTAKPLRPEIAAVARLERADGGPLDLEDPVQATVDARWGYLGSRGQTMPGAGRTVERPAPAAQPAALGAHALDVYLNDAVRWGAVPAAVWEMTLGGYPVLKKWLSYRDVSVLGRPLHSHEADHLRDTARRLAALLLLGPELDAAYRAASA